MQNPMEDTEWNDALRRQGILPPKTKETEVTEEQIERLVDSVIKEHTHIEKKTDDLDLDELDELEDDLDEKVFLEYRQKRIAEMKAAQKSARYGAVIEITGKDYVQEVNEAGNGVWVILHLYKPGIPLCTLINEHFTALAHKFPSVKFLKSLSALCIPNYPDQNLPTIFIYRNGGITQQFIGPSAFGTTLKQDELEWILSETGAIKTDLEDPRPKIKDTLFSQLGVESTQTKSYKGHHESDSDSENDW